MSLTLLVAAFLAIKLGPDESEEVRAAAEELRLALCAEQDGEVRYSTASSPLGGDVFISTQPYAAKGCWRVERKHRILCIHGSDFAATAAAVRHYLKTRQEGRYGVQPEDVFEVEAARVEARQKDFPDWENECVTERNRAPARAYSFPLARVADALVPGLPQTPFVRSLNGIWKFNWCGKPSDRPVDFFRVDYDDSDWFEMPVPACVECHGFGVPIFTNVPYYNLTKPPFTDRNYNPVSSYRTRFVVPPEWEGRRIHLRFEGVASAYYVWINGQKVGYAEDSMLPSEFDVTPYLNVTSNLLAVEVYRWSDGSYLEDQDRFEFSGIHRGVSLWAEPMEGAIGDFSVTADMQGNFSVDGTDADIALYDADFREVIRSSGRVADVHLWSAEDPYLYTLVLKKGDDIRSCKVGFRTVALSPSGAVTVNGAKVKLRGVNWREFSAKEGFTVTEAELEEDIRLLKRGNFNCVRTSHNPASPHFYHLCDRYGIYVQSEANVESHGMGYGTKGLAHPPSWARAQVERGVRMVANYRNFPSVFQWSLGNEAGTGKNFERMRDAMMAMDPTRLYINRNDNENFEIHGHGYLDLQSLERLAKVGPYLNCEDIHAMGNSLGNLEELWRLYYKYDTLHGGCVWDWIDQVVPVRTGRIGADGKEIVYRGYGGDWDEGKHDGAGCVNGILGPEREPNAKYAEVAHVYRPIRVEKRDGRYVLRNLNAFTRADAYAGRWALIDDGLDVAQGEFAVPAVEPWREGEITLPDGIPSPEGEGFIRFSFHLRTATLWAAQGFEIAHDQLPFGGSKAKPRVPSSCGETKVEFSPLTGTISKLVMNGKTVLEDVDGVAFGPRLTVMRAYRDGDLYLKPELDASGVSRLSYHPHPLRERMLGDGTRVVEAKVEVEGARGIGYTHEATYRIAPSGEIRMHNVAIPKGKLPRTMRLGLSFRFAAGLENYWYYGKGPWENYIDRSSACDFGIWRSTVSGQYVDYVRPQDCGYKSDVRWVALTDGQGDGVLIRGSVPMYAQALHYSWEDLFLCRHSGRNSARMFTPLEPRSETCFNFDLRQLGLGNAQCGPRTLSCYAFPICREEWTVTLKPVKGATREKLAELAAEIPQHIPSQQGEARDLRPIGMGYDGG